MYGCLLQLTAKIRLRPIILDYSLIHRQLSGCVSRSFSFVENKLTHSDLMIDVYYTFEVAASECVHARIFSYCSFITFNLNV